jgi:hypothetical protein
MTEFKETDYYFEHIYNGIIFKESTYYPMVEFKIKYDKEYNKDKIVFKDVKFKCGWFIVDAEALKLIGPVNLNLEEIKKEKRVIDDINYPDINGMEIEGISNDVETLISRDQIPMWMVKHLSESVI